MDTAKWNKSHCVLVTGNNGYIGSVISAWLQHAGYDVIGVDTNYFADMQAGPDSLRSSRPCAGSARCAARGSAGLDSVIHLAALSNDPIGNLNEAWTRQINFVATVRLASSPRKRACGASSFPPPASCTACRKRR